MSNMMEYKGYLGSVNYSNEDSVFYGKIEFIRSLVSYEGQDVESLRTQFREAVEDYLQLCQSKGREPEKPFKGSFNVRVGSELHRRAAIAAQKKGIPLNKLITEALSSYLKE